MRGLITAVTVMLLPLIPLVVPVSAQAADLTPDWCAAALAYSADPKAVMDFRRLCTIQKLDEAHAAANDALVQQQVETAVKDARLKAATQELALLREKAKTWCDAVRGYAVAKKYRKFVAEECPVKVPSKAGSIKKPPSAIPAPGL